MGGGQEAYWAPPGVWHPLLYSVHPRGLLSGEVCDAVPQLGPADEDGGYACGVDDHEDEAYAHARAESWKFQLKHQA